MRNFSRKTKIRSFQFCRNKCDEEETSLTYFKTFILTEDSQKDIQIKSDDLWIYNSKYNSTTSKEHIFILAIGTHLLKYKDKNADF